MLQAKIARLRGTRRVQGIKGVEATKAAAYNSCPSEAQESECSLSLASAWVTLNEVADVHHVVLLATSPQIDRYSQLQMVAVIVDVAETELDRPLLKVSHRICKNVLLLFQ